MIAGKLVLLHSISKLWFGISLNSTWRCGVFIPIPDEKYQEPLAKYFVLQTQIPAQCPAKYKSTSKYGVFSKQCGEMVSQYHHLSKEIM